MTRDAIHQRTESHTLKAQVAVWPLGRNYEQAEAVARQVFEGIISGYAVQGVEFHLDVQTLSDHADMPGARRCALFLTVTGKDGVEPIEVQETATRVADALKTRLDSWNAYLGNAILDARFYYRPQEPPPPPPQECAE